MPRSTFLLLTLITMLALTSTGLKASVYPEIDPGRLETLRQAAEASHSDAVVVIQGRETIANWQFTDEPEPIETMSAYKSIVALVVGRLLTTGAIASLDQPVHAFYPEWNQGRKKEITVRHLLNHTSGLQNVPNAGAEIYPAPDAVRLALAAELDSDPGAKFEYNNKAVNLVSGIVHRASGQRLDEYLRSEFFERMGVGEHVFYRDQAGNPHAMAGLRLLAGDFAKFGLIVLEQGQWQGEDFIDATYIDEMLAPGQDHVPTSGLLWWRHPESIRYRLDERRLALFRNRGVPADLVDRLAPLAGRTLSGTDELGRLLIERLGENWREIRDAEFRSRGIDRIMSRRYGAFVAYYADGFLGQYLVVVPASGIVAVRQIANSDDYDPETDGFDDFRKLVIRLTDPEQSDLSLLPESSR